MAKTKAKTKATLRSHFKKYRLHLTEEEAKAKSSIINELAIASISWHKFKRAHIYKPISSLNEISTIQVQDYINHHWPALEITLGEADKNATIPKNVFDLIIVPVLAFDKNKYRLGWGGGWYDKFLATQPKAQKIGLSFESDYSKVILPRDPHDIALDQIYTEKRTY